MTPEPTHPSPEELFAYRDGELPAERRTLLEAHVTTCRICRELIDRVSGLEATLRQRPDSVEGDYYVALSRSVLQKVGAKAPAEGEPVRAAAAAEAARGRPARGADRTETPARERRREEPEEPGLSRAPRLPWAALISTMAAAAAVVVVAVILFRQGPIRSPYLAKAPEVGAPPAGAPAESSAVGEAAGSLARGPEAGKKRSLTGAPATPAAPRAAATMPRGQAPAAEAPARGAYAPSVQPVGLPSGTQATPQAAADRAAQPKAAARPNEILLQQQLEEARSRKEESPAPALEGQQASPMQKPSAGAAPPGAPYASVVRRFGLPGVWTEGAVPRDALLKAEPELRYLYMSGSAGTDSARVRLYLAEAARLRYESAPDSALYETIVHHYWRAIRLAADQPDLARIARQRLLSFSR